MSGFDWKTALEFLLLIAVAYILALPIGWDQEREHQSAGMRVFPIVAAGACALVSLAGKMPGGDVQTQTRIIVGVISAVGFLSGGAILKDSAGSAARGTAAAASIWVTGAIGISVATQQFALAVILSLTVYLSHKVLRPAGNAARDGEQSPAEEKHETGKKHQKNENDSQGGKSEKEANDNEEKSPDESSTAPRQPPRPYWGAQPAEQAQTGIAQANLTNPDAVPEMPGAAPAEGTPASIMGVLVAYKDISVQGLAHRVGLIRDEKEAEYLVDLGPAERLNNLALARGMYMMVHGWVTWVGNRQGLRATQVLYNGGVIDITA